jgi:hypothetical protein
LADQYPYDDRILGGGHFVERVLAQTEPVQSPKTVHDITEIVARHYAINAKDYTIGCFSRFVPTIANIWWGFSLVEYPAETKCVSDTFNAECHISTLSLPVPRFSTDERCLRQTLTFDVFRHRLS